VERSFGLLKKRFFALSTGLRIQNMNQCAKIITCAFMLHNLAIEFGEEEDSSEDDEGNPPLVLNLENEEPDDQSQNTQRNKILNFFEQQRR